MIEQWYEVRADYEKVAAFAPAQKNMVDAASLEESLEQARKIVEVTRSDLYRDKVLQIVRCKQFLNDKQNFRYTEKVVYETHPNVLDMDENPIYKVSASIKEVK